jgi:hypothetical protein
MASFGVRCCVGVFAVALTFMACRAEEESAERADTVPAVAETSATQDTAGEVSQEMGAVTPTAGAEEGAMKRWMLIEFARAVEDTDLQWLQANGFHVDTLMGEKMVRGWLENPEGGPVIDQDARVARIHTLRR